MPVREKVKGEKARIVARIETIPDIIFKMVDVKCI
jgi:hypothetical protein